VSAEGNEPYPSEVALMQKGAHAWTYFEAQSQHPLYICDHDRPDESTCYSKCEARWKPLLAGADSKPLGLWTLVTRKGGHRQWAYRHRPVYTFADDSNETPRGDGKEGHHLLPTFN
jgi:predicted lipoprotein with Yx(FWY)xxD motif